MRQVELQPVNNISISKSEELIDYGITSNGSIYWLELHNQKDYLKKIGLGIFQKTIPDIKNNYIIKYIKDNSINEIHLEGVKFNFHYIIPIEYPNTWLLGNARSNFDKKNGIGEKNFRLINSTGKILKEFCFGDGIEKVLFVKEKIWISYFDEGVYGNYGWQDPIGSSGLVCWDIDGNRLYEYNSSQLDRIDDCYAMNTDQQNIFIHYYSSFPFVEISKNYKINSFQIDFAGSDFSITDKVLLFRKAYSKDNILHLFRRNEQSLALYDEIQLMDNGQPLVEFKTYSNGRYFVICKDRKFYIIDSTVFEEK